jgi:hypothetical protein
VTLSSCAPMSPAHTSVVVNPRVVLTMRRCVAGDFCRSTEEATPATVAAMIRDGGNVCSTSTLLPAAPATESSRRFGDAIKSPIAALRSPLRCQATPRMSDVAQAVAPQPVTVATSTAAAKLEGATRTCVTRCCVVLCCAVRAADAVNLMCGHVP